MLLEHGKEPVSAKWNKEKEKWDIGEKAQYRWLTTNGKTPLSVWMDLNGALQWAIIQSRSTNNIA